MKTVEMSEATRALSELAEPGRHEPVIVTRHGKPVAAVVPIEDTDLETLSLGTNPDFLALIAESRRRCAPGQGISTEEMRARLAEPGR